MATLRTLITTKYILKISAFILGFSFWYILSQSRPIEITYIIPLTFYGNNSCQIEAEETIKVCLKGYKNNLLDLNLKELAIHVNSDQLHVGKNYIHINDENLFLPPEIKLLHYTPSNVVVIVKNT